MIGTARTNPGKDVSHPGAPERRRSARPPLKTVYDALRVARRRRPDLHRRRRHAEDGQQVQALPGATARRAASGSPSSICPRRSTTTTRASTSRSATSRPSSCWPSEIRNLLADAEANRAYFIAETMGRSAGWLAYGAAIAGEASLVISVEDITGKYETSEEIARSRRRGKNDNPPRHGPRRGRQPHRGHDARPRRGEGKEFGVIVMAEGLAEYLPYTHIEGVPRDEHGHIAISKLNLSRLFAELVAQGIHQADRQEAEDHRPATRLRKPLRPARRPST